MQCGVLDWILDKRVLVEKLQNPNKVWGLVNSTVPKLIF